MLTGAEVRKFRQVLGMNQRSFAGDLGLSQAALSLIELGKTPVSEEHLQQLHRAFSGDRADPTFEEFLNELENKRQLGQSMLGYPPGCHATLTVWRWSDAVDLSSSPSAIDAVGSVSLRVNPDDAIAFQMNAESPHWSQNEILVFARSRPDDCKDQDLCLVHLNLSDNPRPKTSMALAHISDAKRGRTFQLQLLDSAVPIYSPSANELLAVLRCIYRAKYV